MNPTGYRCANCGKMLPASRVGIVKCECCGSEYRIEDNYTLRPLKVEQLPFNVQILRGQTEIPREFLQYDPQGVFESSLHRMAEQMAEKLMPLMQLDLQYDPMRMHYIIGSQIRVAYPSTPPQATYEKLERAIRVDAHTVEAKKSSS